MATSGLTMKASLQNKKIAKSLFNVLLMVSHASQSGMTGAIGAAKVAVRRTQSKNDLVDAVIPIHKHQFRLKIAIHWMERLKKPEKSV